MPLDLVIVFVAISVLILIHEFGHFLAAFLFGVWVEEFGLGLPPKIASKKIGQTIYSINLLPLGGFVKLHGEEEYALRWHKSKKLEKAFFKKPWWVRSIILTAGVLMNFFFAVVVISFLFTRGVPIPDKVEIGKVSANSPAAIAGFEEGDILIEIDGIKVSEIMEVTKLVSQRLDKKTVFRLTRTKDSSTQTLSLTAIPRKNPPQGEGALGVTLSQKVVIKSYPFYTAPIHGLTQAMRMSFLLARGVVGVFWDFLSGFRVPKDVAGPIGIYQLYGEARKYGLLSVLELSGLISLNLAVVNLFPLPPLDGSRLLFVLLERVTGKKLRKEWEQKMYRLSLLLLIALFILISIQDIKRLFGL